MDFLSVYCCSCDNEAKLEDLDYCSDCEEFSHSPEKDLCHYNEVFGCTSHEYISSISLTCNICHRGINTDRYLRDVGYCKTCDSQVHGGERNACWTKHLEVCDYIAKVKKFQERCKAGEHDK